MAYTLSTSYVGESLLSGFDWINGVDPSHGFVSYQAREDAERQQLFAVDPDTQVVRLGVDSTNTYELHEGRPSIRLESKESWTHGLFIADFLHMPPSQCGLWPAFWTYGSNWPNGGELDVIEGANTAYNNLISAHTADGCLQEPEAEALFSGERRNMDCAVGSENIGCGFNPPAEDGSSYGDGFNAAGGGVYAMQWDAERIKVWHFARGDIPADIEAGSPRPDSWGLPQALFGGPSCDVDGFFKDMSLVININFCGDYGSAVWGKTDSCTDFAPTCVEYVANNPGAFASAYWDVKFIDVYQWDPSAVVEADPTTTLTMTSLSTAFVTVDGSEATAQPASVDNPLTIGGFSHIGCYGSSTGFETFEEVQDSADMTLDSCVELCSTSTYAGVTDSTCYCADQLDQGTQAVKPADGSTCDLPCPGAPGSFCGGAGPASAPGSFLLTVYGAVLEDELPLPPPMANPAAPMPPVIVDAAASAEDDYEYAVVTITSCSSSEPYGVQTAAAAAAAAVTPADVNNLIAVPPPPPPFATMTELVHPANATRPLSTRPPLVTAAPLSAAVSKPPADVKRALLVCFVVSVAMMLI